MLGGLAVRRPRRVSLLLIAALAWTILEPALVTSFGTCDYCGWDDHHTLSEREQQHIWMREAFDFLYGDCYYWGFQPYYYSLPNYYQASNYYRAPYYYQIPVASQPESNNTADYWLNKGNGFYLAGSYDQATTSYAEAVKLDPYLPEGWLNMGNALYFLGRYQESLNAYDAVLGLEPQNVNALNGESQALLALNRTNEANLALESIRALQNRKIAQLGSSAKPNLKAAVIGDYTS
jgi:tetratricopeptide (TPR) repeat protein